MVPTYHTAKVHGSADPGHWGGTYVSGPFLILLEVEDAGENKAPEIAAELLSKLQKRISVPDSLKSDPSALIAEVRNEKTLVSCIICTIGQDSIRFAGFGQAEVLLIRHGKTGSILEGSQITQGKINTGDVFLLSSRTFITHTDKPKRQELLRLGTIHESAALISAFLADKPESFGATALFLSFPDIGIEEPESGMPLQTKVNTLLNEEEPDSTENPDDNRIILVDPRRKKLLFLAVLLTVLLVSSQFITIGGGVKNVNHEKYTQTLDLVSHQYDEAISLIDLDPVRARSLLSDSKLALAPYLKDFPNDSIENKKIKEWLGKISEQEVAAYKIYKLTAVPLFFDISLIKANGEGTKIAAYKEMKVILDQKNQVLYKLATDTKQSAIIAGPDIVKAGSAVTIHGKNAYVLTSSGIVAINVTDKTRTTVVLGDTDWGIISDMAAFGGNLYLLDKTKNTIWKYIATENGFSSRYTYLNSDVKPDLSGATAFAIDGSIWVLNSPSKVVRFTHGVNDPFIVKGFSDTMSDLAGLSTDDTATHIYFLDRGASRIIVFEKDGTYDSQYQWDDLKNATDLIASEDEKKIFVLLSNKIYAIDIK